MKIRKVEYNIHQISRYFVAKSIQSGEVKFNNPSLPKTVEEMIAIAKGEAK
jgi:hypothetical protein